MAETTRSYVFTKEFTQRTNRRQYDNENFFLKKLSASDFCDEKKRVHAFFFTYLCHSSKLKLKRIISPL